MVSVARMQRTSDCVGYNTYSLIRYVTDFVSYPQDGHVKILICFMVWWKAEGGPVSGQSEDEFI